MLVYSSLFARWAFIVQPQNLALCACHISNVIAQSNQMRRAIEFKLSNGEHEVVADLRNKACMFIAGTGILIAGGPRIQSKIVEAKMGPVSAAAGAAAGPFTTHFWAPMSKWLISGASFMDLVILLFHTQISVAISASALYPVSYLNLYPSDIPFVQNRPTDKISLSQYTALTATGFFFSRYALLVTPVNYTLCSVNVALFGSSGWHLGRKIKADYIDDDKPKAIEQ